MSSGAHQLTGSANLPNVTVAFPGEHWSDAVLSGGAAITPGAACVLTASGTKLAVRAAQAGDNAIDILIAKRCVDIPDVNTGPSALGPNEISNTDIEVGEYVHRYRSGAFWLTLVDPNRTYVPGGKVGWDLDGARPTGKSGTGSWAPDANADVDSVFEVQEVIDIDGASGDVILGVTFRNRGQF